MTIQNLKLLLSGFLQVYFVAINTVFLAKGLTVGVAFVGFMISFVWSFNVKRIAFGGMKDKLIYSTGAAAGSVLGLLTTKLFI